MLRRLLRYLPRQIHSRGYKKQPEFDTSFSASNYWLERKPYKPAKMQNYKYFYILDFEATCEKNAKIEPQEIIEFPCLKVNGNTFRIEDTFHEYVQPKANPVLTPFCIDLTGILQEMVDGKPHFEQVLSSFRNWLQQHQFNGKENIFVTCGDWDLQVMLPAQCRFSNTEIPQEMKKWINIKKAFAAAMDYFPRGIMNMLHKLNIPHQGRLHSGIEELVSQLQTHYLFMGDVNAHHPLWGVPPACARDDCHNIAIVMKHLAERGYIFEQTSALNLTGTVHGAVRPTENRQKFRI